MKKLSFISVGVCSLTRSLLAVTIVSSYQVPDGLVEGAPLNRTNRTYIRREDGSLLMMNKNGYILNENRIQMPHTVDSVTCMTRMDTYKTCAELESA
ncbi:MULTISPECIES: hypothetical protein [unclassified Lentimonas]|uniref:hypothetical protein n=1 Tax=unclassified Lentimonas TaxID=2630993 RepID=UPI00132C5FC4|nr:MULTISPECIES: hypothetical protein [unclassified Lentimonas]CAA6692715.1 Unannotated [Lentimonas sp. CC10]CAA6696719.1 Unannotated [Lentimonas sp. CC19]CAA7072301.1 Unannotated [Lentimonas sp. CC11]